MFNAFLAGVLSHYFSKKIKIEVDKRKQLLKEVNDILFNYKKEEIFQILKNLHHKIKNYQMNEDFEKLLQCFVSQGLNDNFYEIINQYRQHEREHESCEEKTKEKNTVVDKANELKKQLGIPLSSFIRTNEKEKYKTML